MHVIFSVQNYMMKNISGNLLKRFIFLHSIVHFFAAQMTSQFSQIWLSYMPVLWLICDEALLIYYYMYISSYCRLDNSDNDRNSSNTLLKIFKGTPDNSP